MAVIIKLNGPILDNDTAELYEWIGWDCTCPKKLEKALLEAGGEDVILKVNSPGGYCDYGFEMYRILKEYEGHIEAHIVCAASAMTIVCCAADVVKMSDAAMYMIHNTSASASGDYRDMVSTAECLQEYNESAINVYEKRTGKSREELQEMMDHTTWMAPQKAIDEGFADGYLFEEEPQQSDDPSAELNASPNHAIQAYNASIPLMQKEKALKIITSLKMQREEEETQKPGGNSGSDRGTENNELDNEGGKETMTLTELLENDPDARAEYQAALDQAAEDAVNAENTRLQNLDALSSSVDSETLAKAKYGSESERMEAAELAYQTLVTDGEKRKNYMTNALDDSTESQVDDVGGGRSDEEATDESSSMAAYVNQKKGWHPGRKEDK